MIKAEVAGLHSGSITIMQSRGEEILVMLVFRFIVSSIDFVQTVPGPLLCWGFVDYIWCDALKNLLHSFDRNS